MLTPRGLTKALCALALVPLAILPFAPALAKQAKPAASGRAWYWEQQTQQKAPNPTGGDAATVELTNPFCPAVPGGLGNVPEQCREGRLPVEVLGGDYETPDKISAIAWDFLSVPFGSTVSKFTVTFVEASDPQSEPLNPGGKEIQACMLTQFFGDGEAREYKEAPKFECKKTDPIAKRKEVKPKNEGDDPTFEWTFDMTDFAQTWAKGKSPVAGVMLNPVKPKEGTPADDADWRIVFVGPDEGKGEGVKTLLVYEEPEIPDIEVPPTENQPPPSSGPVIPPATGTDGTDFSTSTSTGTTDFGTSTPVTPSSDPGVADTPIDTAADPLAAPESEQAADITEVENLPGYVWLAILGGLIGFTLVKRTVLETATGMRPDGVLAQIRRMNAVRDGSAAAAAAEGAEASGGAGFFTKAKDLLGNLRFGRKG